MSKPSCALVQRRETPFGGALSRHLQAAFDVVGIAIADVPRIEFGRDATVVIVANDHGVDFGRPATDDDMGPPVKQDAHVVLLSPWVAAHSTACLALEDQVLRNGGAVLRLGRVLHTDDPLLERWRKALEEGVYVAPLDVPCAPVDADTAAAATALVVGEALAGRFALSAPDQVSYRAIALAISARLGLPETRVVSNGGVPEDFGLDSWPTQAVLQTSAVFHDGAIVPQRARSVIDAAVAGLFDGV